MTLITKIMRTIGEYFTFDNFYTDAADNAVVNEFTLDVLKLLDGPIEEGIMSLPSQMI